MGCKLYSLDNSWIPFITGLILWTHDKHQSFQTSEKACNLYPLLRDTLYLYCILIMKNVTVSTDVLTYNWVNNRYVIFIILTSISLYSYNINYLFFTKIYIIGPENLNFCKRHNFLCAIHTHFFFCMDGTVALRSVIPNFPMCYSFAASPKLIHIHFECTLFVIDKTDKTKVGIFIAHYVWIHLLKLEMIILKRW